VSSRRSKTGDEALIVDPVGGSLLIRTDRDPTGALTAMSRALRPQPDCTYVVCAPSVTARPDWIAILARVIDGRVVDPDVEVCLVILGRPPERSTVDPDLRSLAERTGRPILAPLGPVTVGADGSAAAAAGPEARGGWATYAPGCSPHYRPAWIPLPEWGKSVAPDAARVAVRGAVMVHPVPAGFWVLPAGEVPGRAGPAAAVAPEPTTMTVFIGGSTESPAPFDSVVDALTAIPMTDHCRVVLLPRALPPHGGVAELRALCGPSIALEAAVPIWSDAKWSLAPISPRGQLGCPAPVAGSPWYGEPTRPRPTSLTSASASTPVPVPRPGSHRDRSRRTDPAPLPGVPTPAGWSFLAEARPVGVVRAAAGTVIEVDATPAGFVLDGRSIAARTLADLMTAASPSRSGAVIVVAHGSVPTASDRPAFAQLADELGRDVIAADADVSMSLFGVLYTAGSFHLWMAGPETKGPLSTRTRALGDVLPGWPSGPAPRSEVPPRPPDPGSERPVPQLGRSARSFRSTSPRRAAMMPTGTASATSLTASTTNRRKPSPGS
jgi:hypothetical protein